MNKTQLRNVFIFPCGSMVGLGLDEHLAYSSMFNIIGGTSVKNKGGFVFENLITPRVYLCLQEIDKYPVSLKPEIGKGKE